MLFNSLEFAFFLPIVFVLYWFFFNRTRNLQNFLLLIASYFFYSCWDWRFLFLLMFSTVLDYLAGLKIQTAQSPQIRKRWFWLSVSMNLGFLGIFKYYNFFIESFLETFSLLGWTPSLIHIILPVGISFYTFHGLSYIIDVYNRKIQSEKNIVDYAVFVSFFPLLVAGPIERATHLLPQIKKERRFDYAMAVDGLRQIIWGLFKKIVIANNCAEFADHAFNNSDLSSGSTLLFGALFFSFQIYGDFSGYSDIAIGSAKLFGIKLIRNFAFPYFSRNVAEFWKRWHISLSSWFKDYVYIPLGGNSGSNIKRVKNIFIVFILSALWHGANWTFVMWGLLNAIFIIPSVFKKQRQDYSVIAANERKLPTLNEFVSIIITFSITVLAWIFFRADNINHAFSYLTGIFTASLFTVPQFIMMIKALTTIILILVCIIIEWHGRRDQYAIENLGLKWGRPLRISFYYAIIISIFYFGGSQQEFIYFQF